MLTIWLLGGLGLLFTTILLVCIIKYDTCHEGYIFGIAFPAILLFVIFMITVSALPTQYQNSLYLPLQIQAIENTIEQQTALISDEATIGDGLQGLEIKRDISQNIRELNSLIARVQFMQISPWVVFKPDYPV